MSEATQSERDLREAVIKGKFGKVEELLKDKNVDKYESHGQPTLCLAALNGHYEICRLLLEKGAAVDKADSNGWTPLIAAASKRHQEICELLLDKRAKVNVKNNNEWTPLMMAASNGDQQTCQLLLRKGAAVNLKDKDGRSALMMAVNLNKMDVCECLLNHGADIELKDNDGRTALDISYTNVKNEQINDMLKAQSIIRKKKEILEVREEYKNLQRLQKRNTENEEIVQFLKRRNGETDTFLQNRRTENHLYNVLCKHKAEYEKCIKDLSDEIKRNQCITGHTDRNADQLRKEINQLENCFKEGKYKEIVEI